MRMRVVRTDEAGALEEVAGVLNAGGVAAIPTDTVYGLAAHPGFPGAVERLYTIKGRAEGKPVALLAADAEAVARFGYAAPADAAGYWPGAFTAVLPAAAGSGKAGKEGFRVPDHDWTRELLRRCGGVLRVTSANLSGAKAAADAEAALAVAGLGADILADGGAARTGEASTVAEALPGGGWRVLREGAVKPAGAVTAAEERAALDLIGRLLGRITGRGEMRLEAGDARDGVEGWDSLAQIQLTAELQRECGCRFATQEMLGWRTAGDVAASVVRIKTTISNQQPAASSQCHPRLAKANRGKESSEAE